MSDEIQYLLLYKERLEGNYIINSLWKTDFLLRCVQFDFFRDKFNYKYGNLIPMELNLKKITQEYIKSK